MVARRNVVAVVEDDPILRVAVEALLTGCGYTVRTYASAGEFLGAAAASQPACIVTDVELGEISGVEMARELADCGIEVPIIFMTGSSDPEVRRQAMVLGCVAYLNKPFPPQRLIELVEAVTQDQCARADQRRIIAARDTLH